MAKLTKAQHADISAALDGLRRAQAFIASDRVVVCSRDKVATSTLHFTRAYVPGLDRHPDDALPLTSIAKDIGSPLCFIPTAIRRLERLLES
jgi:hypothetical protein